MERQARIALAFPRERAPRMQHGGSGPTTGNGGVTGGARGCSSQGLDLDFRLYSVGEETPNAVLPNALSPALSTRTVVLSESVRVLVTIDVCLKVGDGSVLGFGPLHFCRVWAVRQPRGGAVRPP